MAGKTLALVHRANRTDLEWDWEEEVPVEERRDRGREVGGEERGEEGVVPDREEEEERQERRQEEVAAEWRVVEV